MTLNNPLVVQMGSTDPGQDPLSADKETLIGCSSRRPPNKVREYPEYDANQILDVIDARREGILHVV